MINRLYDYIIKKHVEILTAVFVLVSIFLLFQTENHTIQSIQIRWSDFITSVRKPVSNVQRKKHLISRNSDLRKEVFELRSQISRMDYLENENARLRSLLDFRDTSAHTLIAAQIIYSGYKREGFVIEIDKGRRDKITSGDIIVNHKGLVGRVIKSGKRASLAHVINEPNARVSVRITPSGVFGILKWYQAGTFIIEDIPNTVTISKGDRVCTSGFSRIFPSDIPVGKITDVRPSKNGFTFLVYGRYNVNFQKLKNILVIHEDQ